MRMYAVHANGGIGSLAYDAHHCMKIAAAMRASGQPAAVVHSDAIDPSSGTVPADTTWAAAEAYELGYSHGWDHANYTSAYEQADRQTPFSINIPGQFTGRDAEEYSTGYDNGVNDFYDEDENIA